MEKVTIYKSIPCHTCGELVYFDLSKMITCNSNTGKKYWCPNGELPKPSKCKHCNGDLIFDRLYYKDFRGMFIALNKDKSMHRCKNEKKKL